MSNKSVLLLGGSGTLGKSILSKLKLNQNFNIFSPSSKKLNFNNKNIEKKLFKILREKNFDIIINCAGIFGLNDASFNNIININTYSNWIILKYFIFNKPVKKTKIILLGSSAYNSPRKNYIIYAASKAALNSIYKSAIDYFATNSKIHIHILNPKRFRSKMTMSFSEKSFKTTASAVANKIYKIVKN